MHPVNLRKLARGAKGDVKRIVRAATSAGWAVTMTGGNHIRLDHPAAGRPGLRTAHTRRGSPPTSACVATLKRALK